MISWLVTKASDAHVGEPENISHNPFKILLKWDKVKRFVNGDFDRADMTSFAHLISTRNLPNGDRRAKAKALREFKELTSVAFDVTDKNLAKLEFMSERIGIICRTIKGDNHLQGGHVSLNTSGEIYHPQLEGGKAAAAVRDLKEFLNEIPSSLEVYDYPFGHVTYPRGRCRWQAFSVAEYPPTQKFLEPVCLDRLPPDFIEDAGVYDASLNRLAGCGPYTGALLYVTAYTMYTRWKENPMEFLSIRQCSVPEPGGKCRMVTTSYWWLGLLQQPAIHELKEMVALHPSAHSCLLRCDQAWQLTHVLKNMRISSLTEGERRLRRKYYVLSSDLKSATDAIPHSVCRALLNGFLKGIQNDKWSFLIELIGNRTVFCEDDSFFILRRGIMMGEPFSKLCLVLLGLVIEEKAFREFTMSKPYSDADSPRVRWRGYHLGGDDHFAIGPLDYLHCITRNHILYGSLISKTKHRISRRFAVYTERLLYFWSKDNIVINMDPKDINDNVSRSIFIDSIKIRLLSPYSKTTESYNEKNIAIGKAIGLMKNANYLKTPQEISDLRTAYDRFLYRFRGWLPSRHHPKMFAFLGLPVKLGGLGLTLDLDSVLINMAPVINIALRIMSRGGKDSFLIRKILTSVMKNSVPRGVSLMEEQNFFAAHQMEKFVKNPHTCGARNLSDVLRQFNPDGSKSFRRAISDANHAGVIPLSDLPLVFERQHLMSRLLEKQEPSKYFNSTPIHKRFAKLWGNLEEFYSSMKASEVPHSSPLDRDEFRLAVRNAGYEVFIDLDTESTIYYVDSSNPDFWKNPFGDAMEIRPITIRDSITFGYPQLNFSGSIATSNISDTLQDVPPSGHLLMEVWPRIRRRLEAAQGERLRRLKKASEHSSRPSAAPPKAVPERETHIDNVMKVLDRYFPT